MKIGIYYLACVSNNKKPQCSMSPIIVMRGKIGQEPRSIHASCRTVAVLLVNVSCLGGDGATCIDRG
ncbi:hypothetical protein HBH70_231530 [Parastagonospora nodorum]|nr:hypothetical protein HBH51_227810 [Parastagonospora nodorum]KAH4012153.1 hypothetical protein HBI09_224750 [Parastagonospora nodorum]KAH4056726.1 hypothetical protein HBH50_239510 [Parastagonospora nodorum]KAH4077771.1 hypothetical protein HBH48_237170 [Parastagonospora nodorum]KAH4215819.1 hypothetical protein HBI06_240330 [Parastagonospora nodorum]